ncbi:MAG TPA: class I SAM-dependent methyltransferase [Candidatus Baltobacteraceae bacterium]|nr:class I SAM-dependent methyltransferase [Candidatus Baltobacteraceae bacterium]
MANERSSGRRFDRDYGVTTQAILFLTDLDADAAGDAAIHATHYEPVPVADFRALMACVPPDVIARSTFVDVGAGMGRGVLLASEYAFVQVAGVEVSPGLFEVARDNVAHSIPGTRRRCNDIRILRDDARIWNYPPGDLVVFMYNPFDASALRSTLGAILDRRNAGATWLLYHTPAERAVLDDDPDWEPLAEVRAGALWRRR